MIVEIAIAVDDRGGKRAKQGDIIVARKPLGLVGRKEANLLFFRIDTDLTPSQLKEYEADRDENGALVHSDQPGEGKRRYNIPLKHIVDATGIDAARVKDPRDNYQPLNGRVILPRNPQLNRRVPAEKTLIDGGRL